MKTKILLSLAMAACADLAFSACSTTSQRASDTAALTSASLSPLASAPAAMPVASITPAPVSFWSKVKTWWSAESKSPAVQALAAETKQLLNTFIYKAGMAKLTGSNWSYSLSAGINASLDTLANDPTQLNKLIGVYVPANSSWSPVVTQLADSLVQKAATGQLATKEQRVAALSAIANQLCTQAAANAAP